MAPITLKINPTKYRHAYENISANASIPATFRSKRTSGGVPITGRTTIQRSASNSSDDRRQSLKLTVKAPPSKLREVMRANELEALHDTLGGGQVIDGPRRRRAAAPPRTSGRIRRPKYAEYDEDDIEDDDEVQRDEEEEDDFTKIGAEAEGGTDDEEEDIEMPDAPMPPKPPKITLKAPAKTETKPPPNPKLIITPATVGPVKSVEDQEMEDEPGDDEVEDSSDLSNDDEEDEDDDEEEDDEDEDDEEEEEEEEEEVQQTILNEDGAQGEEGVEDDAQGEDEEMEDDEEDDDVDSSDDTPASGAATPDPNKLTKRQRGRAEEAGGLMSLDMAPQQRKVSFHPKSLGYKITVVSSSQTQRKQ
jgi:Ino eighty subunit 2